MTHASPDAKRLSAIRARIELVSSTEWELASDSEGMFLDALEGTAGGTSRIQLVRFGKHATYDEAQLIAGSLSDMRFLLGLVDRALAFVAAARRSHQQPSSAPREPVKSGPKNYATEAVMKCQEPAFKRFLVECHSLESPVTDDRVAQRLRSILGVTSRRELNNNNQAAARWKALRSEYDAWRRVG